MTTANWIYVIGAWLFPCCALSFWSRDTWAFVRRDLEVGRVTLFVMLVMSAIGSVLTWWLPRLPPMPEKPLRSCERCESLVSSTPLGPAPLCSHPSASVKPMPDGTHLCLGCDEPVTLVPPRTQEEADRLLEQGPVWRVASRTASPVIDSAADVPF